MVLPCSAAESGKITVTLESNDKAPIDGVTVLLCQVAQLNSTGYTPTKPFENSGISLTRIAENPNEAAAKTIADFVAECRVDTLSAEVENGQATFSELDLGIWLVYCEKNENYTFNPFLVLLPSESEGKLYYEVSSAPKVQDGKPDEISVYVLKKWDDKNNAAKKRPESVTVELLNGDTVVSSVVLNEDNGWAHLFTDLKKDGTYSVREKDVTHYKADYSGDATNGFIITNTYMGDKLPQTGQYWWPIVIMAVAGVCFVLLGIYELGVKKHGKSK